MGGWLDERMVGWVDDWMGDVEMAEDRRIGKRARFIFQKYRLRPGA